MEHLDAIPLEELQEALDTVEGKKPAVRLLAAIAYKHGVTQTELAEWYGVQRRTIYNWLVRLDTDEPLERAVTDDDRPGRSRKLTQEQQESFEETVRDSPGEVGIDAPAWTPALAQQYLQDEYGVDYSLPSCRRLLREAGLRYRRPRHGADEPGGGASEDRQSTRGRWTL